MFGVSKEQLVKSLCRISVRSCGYMGSRCDCKYISSPDDAVSFGSEATGCPETIMAASLINMMTVQEFHALTQRASIEIIPQEQQKVEIDILMQKLKNQRDIRMKQNTQNFVTERAAKKAARAAKKAAKK